MISQRSGWSECWKGAGVSTETEDGQLPGTGFTDTGAAG